MSLIKRFVLLALGLLAAFYAMQLGVIVPWTVPLWSWTGDTFSRYDLLLVVVSVLAVVSTIFANLASFEEFAKDVQKTYVSTSDILWVMAFLVVSSLALGMHLKPAGTNPVDWFWAAPFAWQIVMIAVLAPTVFLLVNLEIEIFVADSAHEKRVLEGVDPLQAHIKNSGSQMTSLASAIDGLKNALQTHRDAFGHRMDQVDARDKAAAESLNAVNKALADVLARLPPAGPLVIEESGGERKVAA